MKKIFTLLSLLLFVVGASAQDYYVFSDKDGNIYEDGAIITCSEAESDPFGQLQVPSGLFMKNAGAPDGYQVSIQANITKMDNGSLQLCFPVNCASYNATGKQAETAKGTVALNQVKNLMTEWFPITYGECTVTYTAKMYQSFFAKGERTITVNYIYADPTSVNQIDDNTVQPKAYYDMQGRYSNTARHGLNIVRMSDGSVRKIILK